MGHIRLLEYPTGIYLIYMGSYGVYYLYMKLTVGQITSIIVCECEKHALLFFLLKLVYMGLTPYGFFFSKGDNLNAFIEVSCILYTDDLK